jgi:hypothetical protein
MGAPLFRGIFAAHARDVALLDAQGRAGRVCAWR